MNPFPVGSFLCVAVVALLVSEDGVYIQKDTLVDFVKACDGVAPRVDLATLFTGEVCCRGHLCV